MNARELATARAGAAPTAQLEQFIPAVMAAMPLIRAGVRVAGRQRVVGVVAAAIAQLIRGMVGQQAATQLSRHIADAGLRLLGLEAEQASDTLGAEALAAAAEDTVREVLSMSPEAFGDDRLLTAEVQRAFIEAAARHLPAAVLRPEVVERESGGEHAIWLMMPRATRPLLPLRLCCIPGGRAGVGSRRGAAQTARACSVKAAARRRWAGTSVAIS